MSQERRLLASVIKSRKAFTQVLAFVTDEDLSEQGQMVWQEVISFYDTDEEAQKVDVDILGNMVARKVPSDKHKEMFKRMVNSLADEDVSADNAVKDLLETKKDSAASRLAAALLANEEATGLIEDYSELQNATSLVSETPVEARIGMSVQDLLDQGFSGESLIDLYPEPLNNMIDGGLKPEHHIVVFARPEMGKTALVIEMTCGFAKQGLTTLYIGNEDPINDINMRVITNLSGMSKLEVYNKPQEADQKARDNGYDNVILMPLTPGTPREIVALIEKYKPHVLVLDQLRNLNMGIDNYVLKLEAAATQARNWAKKYSCVVVSVTQAGDNAANKSVLDLGDVDFSKTGIPSQADLMVGIGASKEQALKDEVVLSLPKNKISGRHDYAHCKIIPTLSKIEGI